MRLNPGQRCGATAGSDADVYIQGRQSTESSEDTAQGEERKRAAIGEVWELLNTVCLGKKYGANYSYTPESSGKVIPFMTLITRKRYQWILKRLP